MKKIYWIIIVAIIFSALLVGILINNAEKGIKVNVIDVGTFGIELYLNDTPLYKESKVIVMINSFRTEGTYLIERNERYQSLIGFLPTDEFLENLNLTWDCSAQEILQAIQKKEVRIKAI